jgi:PKD repeat protein
MKKTATLRFILFTLSFLFALNSITYSQSNALLDQRRAIAKHHEIKSGALNNMKIDTLNNIEQSISNVLFGGCVCISNLTYTGPHLSIGYFVDPSGTLGIDSGLVMTTGSVVGIEDTASYFACTSNSTPGDSLLNTLIPPWTTYDASIIEFDFIPLADTIIGCNYIFASEEYPEFVGSSFNDVFGFFISGPGITGTQNIALIPGTSIPVAINNVNAGSYSQYYVDNSAGTHWCYDGYTTPFTLFYPVVPGSLYHFKIAIADAGDGVFDSGVFLKGGSFLGNTPGSIAKYNTSVDNGTFTATFTNQSEHATQYYWDFDDGTFSTDENPVHIYSSAGIYHVKLHASNICNSDSIYHSIDFTTVGLNSENNHSFSFSTIEKGLYNLSFTLDIPAELNIRILNNNGQMVYNDKRNADSKLFSGLLDLREFADGIYFLNVQSGTYSHSYKIVK